MPESIVIDGGRRTGRTLANEAAFRKAIAEGKDVLTGPRNGSGRGDGVWFRVTIDEAGAIVYTALPKRPEGV